VLEIYKHVSQTVALCLQERRTRFRGDDDDVRKQNSDCGWNGQPQGKQPETGHKRQSFQGSSASGKYVVHMLVEIVLFAKYN
jgi:hypothetical protein